MSSAAARSSAKHRLRESIDLRIVQRDDRDTVRTPLDEHKFSHPATLRVSRRSPEAAIQCHERLAVDAFEHFVGGGPWIEAVCGDVGLQLVPALAGGQLPGALFETAGDDLAQLLADTELAAAGQLARRLDRRPVGNDR